jgi:hypothetical protein
MNYYLQNGYIGNSIAWWAKGRCGYTTNIDKAHIFTEAEAFTQHDSRKSDMPYPCLYIDARTQRTVDSQGISKAEAGRFILEASAGL